MLSFVGLFTKWGIGTVQSIYTIARLHCSPALLTARIQLQAKQSTEHNLTSLLNNDSRDLLFNSSPDRSAQKYGG